MTVKSVSSSTTLSKVPELLIPSVGLTPPLSVIVPPLMVPPSKISGPLAGVSASTSPLLSINPVKFTVPPLRVNPFARFRPAVVKLLPRFSVPPSTLIWPPTFVQLLPAIDSVLLLSTCNTPPALLTSPVMLARPPPVALTVPVLVNVLGSIVNVLPRVSAMMLPWLLMPRLPRPISPLWLPRTVMFEPIVSVSPPLLANIRPKTPVPSNNTSAVPPASALRVWLPSKRKSVKLLMLLMLILRPFFKTSPFFTNKVEPLVMVKSMSRMTPLKVPDELPASTGTTPPLSEIVPPVITPGLTKFITPLLALSVRVSPLLATPLLSRLPVMFTVPPLLIKPLARLSEAVL